MFLCEPFTCDVCRCKKGKVPRAFVVSVALRDSAILIQRSLPCNLKSSQAASHASKSKTHHLTERSIPIGAFLREEAGLAPSLTMANLLSTIFMSPSAMQHMVFSTDPPPRAFSLPIRKMAKFIVPPCKTPHDERFKVGARCLIYTPTLHAILCNV
ncbi:hypothetical protein AVEN_59604-1 [Araneus ventricosus]|uniref:Uncharacterized protein n=1 Tax=Araneus ventricosus TaxID=182803 RepID=A0A4Y2J3G1_ARAVE|nr:hypothetical protein AVEN_59604-1 [Araneus ventricosus]